MNGFTRRTAHLAAAIALGCVGCSSTHVYKQTVATPPVEGSVAQVSYKDSLSAAGGAPVAAAAMHPEHSSGITPAAPGANGARPLEISTCACGRAGCNGGCGRGSLHDKLRDCDWEELRPDHCWPEQYNYEARRGVNQPLHDQIAAGHATINTPHDFHFEPKGDARGLLSDAGKSRLNYYVRRKPYVVPSVFIQTTFDPALDQQRMKSVRDYLMTVSVEPTDWQLTLVDSSPTGQNGKEAIYTIEKAIGPSQGMNVPAPYYERILKNNFFLGSGGGQTVSGGGGS